MPYQKRNYQPVNVLSNLSEMFENVPYNEIVPYFEKRLSKHLTGFWKDFDEQACLVVMEFFRFQKFRKSWGQGSEYDTLPTGPWKAFDCLPHDLIIRKLHAYGFDMPPLRLIHSYLPNRYLRVKISISYNLWSLIRYGVPQGSIFSPIPFNVNLWYVLFDWNSRVSYVSYVDTKTL